MPHSRLVLSAILVTCFLMLPYQWAAAALPGEHLLQEQQLCEAQGALHEMMQTVDGLEGELRAQPEMLNDPEWISETLSRMALVDQVVRKALFASLDKSWEPEVFKTYVRFFINPHPNNDEGPGFLQQLDREHYERLKRILTQSNALGEDGWPSPPQYDSSASYHAFLLARRGVPYDGEWLHTSLIPRLEQISQSGAIPAPAVAWLTASSPEELAVVVKKLGEAGPPWSNLAEQAKRTEQLLNAIRKAADAELLPPLTPARCGPKEIRVEPAANAANRTRAGSASSK